MNRERLRKLLLYLDYLTFVLRRELLEKPEPAKKQRKRKRREKV